MAPWSSRAAVRIAGVHAVTARVSFLFLVALFLLTTHYTVPVTFLLALSLSSFSLMHEVSQWRFQGLLTLPGNISFAGFSLPRWVSLHYCECSLFPLSIYLFLYGVCVWVQMKGHGMCLLCLCVHGVWVTMFVHAFRDPRLMQVSPLIIFYLILGNRTSYWTCRSSVG